MFTPFCCSCLMFSNFLVLCYLKTQRSIPSITKVCKGTSWLYDHLEKEKGFFLQIILIYFIDVQGLLSKTNISKFWVGWFSFVRRCLYANNLLFMLAFYVSEDIYKIFFARILKPFYVLARMEVRANCVRCMGVQCRRLWMRN